MISGSRFEDEIRALAALEVELDQLLSERVMEARRMKVPWERIAEAAGVAKPTAWRRWKPLEDDARPSRAQRRTGPALVLNQGQAVAARSLADQLVRRVTTPREARPWAKAVRAALDELKLPYESSVVDSGETEFRVKSRRLLITSGEPEENWSGAVRAVRRARLGPDRQSDTEVTVTGLPDSEEDRVKAVTDILRPLL